MSVNTYTTTTKLWTGNLLLSPRKAWAACLRNRSVATGSDINTTLCLDFTQWGRDMVLIVSLRANAASVISGRYWANISDTLLTGEFNQWKEGELKMNSFHAGMCHRDRRVRDDSQMVQV